MTESFGAGDTARPTVFTPDGDVLDRYDANSQRVLELPVGGSYVLRLNSRSLVGTGAYRVDIVCF